MPTVRVIPTPTLTVLGKTNNMSWAQPIDDTHTRVFAMVRKPQGCRRRVCPVYDGNRSWFELSEEEHQRFPGDYEAQTGQGAITLHSEERLASSDRGVSMVRRQFKQQVQIVAEGGDPAGVEFDEAKALVAVEGGQLHPATVDGRSRLSNHGSMAHEFDLDEPPIFDLEERDEIDPGPPRGELVLEGVRIPSDVVAYGNGKLPPAALQEIGVYRHRLHPSAAAAFAELRAAAKEAGIDLSCTDSYRSIEEQIDLKNRKPNLSATPGKSVHGWGFAVDLSLGLPPKAFGNSVSEWLKTNAPEYGWFLGRPKDEPWHGSIAATRQHCLTPRRAATATAAPSATDGRPAGWVVDVDVVRGLLGVAAGANVDAVVAAVVAFSAPTS